MTVEYVWYQGVGFDPNIERRSAFVGSFEALRNWYYHKFFTWNEIAPAAI
jgi:hypothetical protein